MAPKQSENISAVRWQCIIVWAWKTDGTIARSSEDFRSPTDFALEYTFTGKIRGLSRPYDEAMVEYGISRFG